MKHLILFNFHDYYPTGGFSDIACIADNIDDMENYIVENYENLNNYYDTLQLVDLKNEKIITADYIDFKDKAEELYKRMKLGLWDSLIDAGWKFLYEDTGR